MWFDTDGCAKHYHFSSAIYLLSCLSLEFCIIIDIAIGAPVHGKNVGDGLNVREKLMMRL